LGGGREAWRRVTSLITLNGLKSSTSTFTQSLLSLSINLGGLISGAFLAVYLDVLSRAPWGLLLFPGILSIRGSIGGILSSRLGTALHLGTIEPNFLKNTKEYYLSLAAIVTITLFSCLILGGVSTFFGILLLGMSISDLIDLLSVTIVTMGLSIILITPLTIGISISAFKKGLDPDVMVYPVISTLADILVTFCYLTAITKYFESFHGRYVTWIFDLLFVAVVTTILSKNFREKNYIKMMKEFSLSLILVTLIVNISGFSLNRIRESIGNKPKVFMVYPALIDTVGDVGSIVGSTATTKLALGLLTPSFSSIKDHASTVGAAWSASIIMFLAYSTLTSMIYRSLLGGYVHLSLQLLATNSIAVPLIVTVVHIISILTYKYGLDPDNFTVPLESSVADAITTLCLLAALTALP